MCYTSYLKRAITTCGFALEFSDQLHMPVVKSWRLNERMYGGLTGLDKKEIVVNHGAEHAQIWRCSFDLPPPDISDDSEYHPRKETKYRFLTEEDISKTESSIVEKGERGPCGRIAPALHHTGPQVVVTSACGSDFVPGERPS